MQLEQQENFTIHGPQLEILGEVETKLPAPAKKRGTASIVLVALALVSVLGIGGAKLKGMYRETAEIYTSAQDEYGHSIQGDFEAQADAAANQYREVKAPYSMGTSELDKPMKVRFYSGTGDLPHPTGTSISVRCPGKVPDGEARP